MADYLENEIARRLASWSGQRRVAPDPWQRQFRPPSLPPPPERQQFAASSAVSSPAGPAAPGPRPPGAYGPTPNPGQGWLGAFGNTIDSLTSGIWGPHGERLIPNDPARAPGPIGRGPGHWLQDWGVGYTPTGSMVWRNDWVPAPAGDPRGWLISGET